MGGGQRPDPEALGRTVLFGGLPDEDLGRIAASSLVETREAADVVFRRGDPGDRCFIIEEGNVRITLPEEAGADTILDVLGPGGFFGELALIDGAPRSANVVASTRTRLVVLPRDAFLRVVGEHPRVADRLVTVLRDRLQRHALLVGETGPPDVPARLTQAVGDLAKAEQRSQPLVEVLPVLVRDGNPVLLRPPQGVALRRSTAGAVHPGEVVREVLVRCDLAARVTHSTSWRYDAGTLVLTYLAIVDDPGVATVREAGAVLDEMAVARVDLARGDATVAPERITLEHVLEHALRHLRWLLGNDPAVRAAAGPAWPDALADYEPEPFRSLDPAPGSEHANDPGP